MKKSIQHIKQYLKTHKKLLIVLVIIKLLVKIGIAGYLILFTTECKAQSTNKMIRSGNSLYHKQKYNNATEQYTKALQKEPQNGTAFFNHSDALYQLKEYQKAEEQFMNITKSTVKPEIKAKAYHNLGNCYYKQEKYEESVKAYKESLKLTPSDKDTKYNLMMAMAKLKNNQGGGGGNDQQQPDKKDQQQNKNQQQQDQQQQKQQQQQEQNKMSPEEAQRLLEALGNEENKVQQKLEKKKGEPQNGKIQKDW
jgi:Ca-activated chloride channel family protein